MFALRRSFKFKKKTELNMSITLISNADFHLRIILLTFYIIHLND